MLLLTFFKIKILKKKLFQENTEADELSRTFNDDIEWSLDIDIEVIY